jgi:hypothetical protein
MQVTTREKREIAFAEHNEDLRNAVRHAVGEGENFLAAASSITYKKNAMAPRAGVR